MNITTIDDQLAQVRLRIDRMQARAQAGVATDAMPRTRRHLDALHKDEASVRAAAARLPTTSRRRSTD